ncbi:MAG: carboxymuconolactone decarboxylase family protein [Cyclobacteriaceae bacterium]|nr:carboxymuconolactone decarboxylase family protein [Cyclobacteriaceae bacterium]
MSTLKPLTREQANASVQPAFDVLKSKVGMVPNLYATIANSATTLPAYLAFDEALGKGAFNAKERQAIFLVVSQVNGCRYCQSAHTALGKMNGFTEEETIQLRKVTIADKKLNALTSLAAEITRTHGKPSQKALDAFQQAGYGNDALVELVAHIGYKSVANYLHNIAHFPIDFPVAKEIESVPA